MQIILCYYVSENIAVKEGAGWPFDYSKLNKLIILGGINQQGALSAKKLKTTHSLIKCQDVSKSMFSPRLLANSDQSIQNT